MYSSSGGVANGGRVYNPRPDPAEVGPPRRVNREESHVGEMVASSKRRIAWTFTLGESDTIHEVVLVHSILSYKKVVEFDGRQMHFSSTATPGDWSYTMFLDNTKYAIEVRINDLESADVPKYDLAIDRVPFRRWDVYRRRKLGSSGPVPGGSTYGQQSFQHPQPHARSRTQSGGAGDSYGKHTWGPSGMTAPAPMEPVAPQRHSGSFYRSDVPNAHNYQSAPGPYNGAAPSQRQPTQGVAAAFASAQPATAVQAKKTPPQKEIDLLGDFGSSDTTTVTAQELIFDPLASTRLSGSGPQRERTNSNHAVAPSAGGAAQPQRERTGSNSQMGYQQPTAQPQRERTGSNSQMGYPQPTAQHQPQRERTGSNPQMGFPQPTQAYVDPFATVAQPMPIKPAASSFNLDPLAPQNTMYMQPNRAPPAAMASYATYQAPPQGGMPGGMQQQPMQQQQPMRQQSMYQQQQPMQGGYPTQVASMPGGAGGYQPPKVGGGMGGVNYNISHLMNPMEVNSLRNAQQTKTINIDPFAGMQHK